MGWQILDPHAARVSNVKFGGFCFWNEFSFDDSVLSAEMETEVESTSAISSEVRSHSQHLAKELVWPEKSFGEDI